MMRHALMALAMGALAGAPASSAADARLPIASARLEGNELVLDARCAASLDESTITPRRSGFLKSEPPQVYVWLDAKPGRSAGRTVRHRVDLTALVGQPAVVIVELESTPEARFDWKLRGP